MSIVVEFWSRLYGLRGDNNDKSNPRTSAMVFVMKEDEGMAGLKYIADGFLL